MLDPAYNTDDRFATEALKQAGLGRLAMPLGSVALGGLAGYLAGSEGSPPATKIPPGVSTSPLVHPPVDTGPYILRDPPYGTPDNPFTVAPPAVVPYS